MIFPHHENEIAQSEGANGAPFARIWMHNGMLNLSGEKMSKSTGHLVDLNEANERFGGLAVRLFYLQAHYRSPQEFSNDLLEDAQTALARLHRLLEKTIDVNKQPHPGTMAGFEEAMDDDFSTPRALGLLFDAVREAIGAVTGANAETSTSGGTSDGRFIAPTGAEVVEVGPVNATIHKRNERIAVADLAPLARIYERVMTNLLT